MHLFNLAVSSIIGKDMYELTVGACNLLFGGMVFSSINIGGRFFPVELASILLPSWGCGVAIPMPQQNSNSYQRVAKFNSKDCRNLNCLGTVLQAFVNAWNPIGRRGLVAQENDESLRTLQLNV